MITEIEIKPGFSVGKISTYVLQDISSLFNTLQDNLPPAGNFCGGMYYVPEYHEFIAKLRLQILDDLLKLKEKESPWENLEFARQLYL